MLKRHINGASTDGGKLPSATYGTAKKGSVKSVTLVQASAAPITGKFKIQCADSSGNTLATKALAWGVSIWSI